AAVGTGLLRIGQVFNRLTPEAVVFDVLHDVFICRAGHQLYRLDRTAEAVEVLHCLVLLRYAARLSQLAFLDLLAEPARKDIVLRRRRCAGEVRKTLDKYPHGRPRRDVETVLQRDAIQCTDTRLARISTQYGVFG